MNKKENSKSLFKCLEVGVTLTPIVIFLLLVLAMRSGVFMIGPGLADYDYDLSNGYKVHRSSSHNISVSGGDGDFRILQEVVEIAWDDEFILVNQLGQTGNKDDQGFFVVANLYWVLAFTQEPEMYGPMTEEEFLTKREELNIPEELIMTDVEEHRPPIEYPEFD